MPAFTGTLRANEIFGSLFNMIISQEVFSDNISGTFSELVDAARVDGGLYGDTKLYYSVDVLKSTPWGADNEATNLLALHRPAAPETQAIVLNQFRQISLTVDNYLTKRAWMAEGAFSTFNSVMLGMLRDTKRIYDSTLYNTFIGTNETDEGEQSRTITPIAGQNDALTMAEDLANLLIELRDVSRDYNDYGFMRSWDEGSLRVIWNSKHINALRKIDLPTIFHNEGLLNEFKQYVLPARYFGTLVSDDADDFTVPAEGVYRTTVEGDFTGTDAVAVHLFPGDKLPAGAATKENEVYEEDDTIAYKVMHVRSVPLMSAFEVGTSFFNPKSLTENHYLTWGYNELEHLSQYPFITARFQEA